MGTDDEHVVITFAAHCKNQEEAARVLETFSRPMTGLILDGIMITFSRFDPTGPDIT